MASILLPNPAVRGRRCGPTLSSYLLFAFITLTLGCGDSPESSPPIPQPHPTPAPTPDNRVSGQGDYKFRVKYRVSHLPRDARRQMGLLHSGLAVDRRPGRGEVYFGVAGAGIVCLSSDLSKATLIPTQGDMFANQLHNTEIAYDADGSVRLIFPAPDSGEVFTTQLDGKLLDTLHRPTDDVQFSDPTVGEYFRAGGEFKPTDVVQYDETYFIPTGYSDLDKVLTAHIHSHDPFSTEWAPMSFGGRGEKPEQFWTAHGITIEPDGKTFSVTDRLHSAIDRFTPEGKYLGSIQFPKGSQPCDIDYAYGFAVVGSLVNPDQSKGAPIYLLKDDQIVSTIHPKDDLGLELFTHVHDAALDLIDGRLYIIALAWMPGDFVIMEQAKD